jgi:hypothetical protein
MDKTDPYDIIQWFFVRSQQRQGCVKTIVTVGKHREGVKTNCEASQT